MLAFVFPGQGSQRKGMGLDLLDRFPQHVSAADEILGYSVRDFCADGGGERFRRTEYVQPVLFVVNALGYLARKEAGDKPDVLAGHSLGEYNALFAAGSFGFETGVRLLRKRGELMARSVGGGMLAVLGLDAERLARILERCPGIDVANENGTNETVLSGPHDALRAVAEAVERDGRGRCAPLNVSAPFHSRYMAGAAAEFESFLRDVAFEDPRIAVVANVTGRPYGAGEVPQLLAMQIVSPVRWAQTMRYLREQGVSSPVEIGPGQVLTKLWQSQPPHEVPQPHEALAPGAAREELGSREFCRDYGVRYPYVAGAMYKGIASAELVVRMGNAGLIGMFGTGGLELAEIEEAIRAIREALGPSRSYGMNLLYSVDDEELEDATVSLFLRNDVRYVEAAAYLRMTAPLVRFRFSGAHVGANGVPVAVRHVIAKVSRPEIATAFMSPPPEPIVRRLLERGHLTSAEAEAARMLPISEDVCAEADSGGHTDARNAWALIPAIVHLRDEMMRRHRYAKRIRVGASGGIGTPQAAAAAFVLAADFVVTGSVNQCSVEAGTSDAVKEMLAALDIQDTAYAPAGDMFELGARVQVVRKGTLFAARANKLYQLYRQHESLGHIDSGTRSTIEEIYFKRSFEDVWRESEAYLARRKPAELASARRNPKHEMAAVFRWYFVHSARLARAGAEGEKVNYQIHCGPAMGAFNRFVKGSDMDDWRRRHVDAIAERLMSGAAEVLHRASRCRSSV